MNLQRGCTAADHSIRPMITRPKLGLSNEYARIDSGMMQSRAQARARGGHAHNSRLRESLEALVPARDDEVVILVAPTSSGTSR